MSLLSEKKLTRILRSTVTFVNGEKLWAKMFFLKKNSNIRMNRYRTYMDFKTGDKLSSILLDCLFGHNLLASLFIY